MSVKYIGDVKWGQVQDLMWSIDNWGLDNVKVLFRGARTLKTAFENTLQRWTPLPGYSSMRLANWTDTPVTPSFPGIELTYIGFRTGVVPPFRRVDGLNVQSVTTQAEVPENLVNPDGDPETLVTISGEFLYRAARTDWTWFETGTPPLTPRYNAVTDKTDPLTPARVIKYSISNPSTGQYYYQVSLAAFTILYNKIIRLIQVQDYQREELVPGSLWGCKSSVVYSAQ